MVVHAGNAINQMTFEEHDGVNNAKRVNVVAGGVGLATVAIGSAATIFAVVNTAAAGQASVALDNSIAKIGFATVANATAWPDPKTYIGLVTIGGLGTVTLADPKGFIGLVTSVNGAGDRFIGLVTNVQAGLVTLAPSPNFIGLVSVQGTVGLLGNTTVLTRNAGTNKTLQIFPVTISTGSAATVYVPTNKFYLTSLILNANATVRVNVRSGATYLTGNASIGIELNPGSGFVEMGSPDSPVYFGLANTAPIVIEKTDYSGVISRVSGKLITFDE